MTGITVVPTFSNPSGGTYKLDVAATGKVPTSFTKVIGQTNLNIDVSSQVVWGMKKLELALALDNTGSMASSNKMTELKKAAKNLLQTLKTPPRTTATSRSRSSPSPRKSTSARAMSAPTGSVG